VFFQNRTKPGFEVAVDVGGDIFCLANVVAVRHDWTEN
jgi:hypothetical protein